VSNNYWSSTENSSTLAWFQSFGNGNQNRTSKPLSLSVRAVRKIPASTFIGTATEVPSSVIYSTSTTDLVTISNAGFEIYRMNPWWEVFSHNSDMGEVYDTFYEAVDCGIDYILDDRNW
jgi:hypothetical protein